MTAPVEAIRARASPALLLWRFSRPHTIVGTALSVLGIWLLVGRDAPGDLLLTLTAALCVNVFIVGLNQLEDVEIDRVNKPWLPVAAGDLSVGAAKRIVWACAVLPVGMAVTQGAVELAAVVVACLVGVAYSSPPLRLKRWPVLAAISISGVRSIVVNIGVAWHFAGEVGEPIWALTLFVVPFSVAIAILKDVPDIEGDRRYGIGTFSVRLGGARVLRLGLAALGIAYLGMALVGPFVLDEASIPLLVAGHVVPFALLLSWARRVDVADREDFTRFYLRVWGLFFLEYLVAPVVWLAG